MRRALSLATAVVLCLSPATVPAAATSAPTGPVTVFAAADTYVIEEAPDQNNATATKLAASNWSTPWHSDIYLRFTLPPAPAGTRVTSARIELGFQKLTQQPSRVELRSVASATWPETITYRTRPAVGSVVDTATVAAGARTLSFDVTDALGSGSFAITNPTPQSAAVLNSREHGDGPRLVLDHAPATTLCGASFARENGESWQQALAREDSLFNGLEAVRTFYGGLPPAWPGQVDTGDRTHVVSFKRPPREYLAGTHDAYLRDWFAGAPRDKDVYWIYYHEPEDNIAKGEFTAADYRAAWAHLAEIARGVGNPRLHATMVLMEWTLNPASGRDWRDYYPGDGVLDVLAWDVYNYDPRAEDGVYLPPAELLDHVVATNASVGLPFGIAELGSHIATGDDGTRRARWIQEMNDYLTAHGSLWNLWFDLSWPTGDYRLRDNPGVSVWRSFCS